MYQYKLFEIEQEKIKLIKSYVDQFKFPKNRPIKRIQWDPVHPIAPIRVNIGKCIFCGHNLEFHIRSGLDMVTCESCGILSQRDTENVVAGKEFRVVQTLPTIDCTNLYTLLGCNPTLNFDSELSKLQHRIKHEEENRTQRNCVYGCFVCKELNLYGTRHQDYRDQIKVAAEQLKKYNQNKLLTKPGRRIYLAMYTDYKDDLDNIPSLDLLKRYIMLWSDQYGFKIKLKKKRKFLVSESTEVLLSKFHTICDNEFIQPVDSVRFTKAFE